MHRKFWIVLGLAVLLVTAASVPATALADDDVPTVAVLSYDLHTLRNRTIEAVYDVLNYHGYLSHHEIAAIEPGGDFFGNNINVIWREAGGELANIPIMAEYALDQGASVLVTTTTNVTLNAIKASLESGIEPTPLVIFALVTAPYASGVADAPCVKPSNVVGSHALVSYEDVVELLPLQDPDVDYIGSFFSPARPAHVYAVEQITQYAEELGIEVEAAPFVDAADGMLGAETLLDKDVDMIVSLGFPTSLPAIVDAANVAQVPIVSASISHLPRGVHIAGGFYAYYQEGLVIGRMLTAALDGELDAARTGIHAAPRLTVGLNLDTINEADIDVSDALMERVDFVYQDGESSEVFVKPELPKVEPEDRRTERAAFLDTLHCSDEAIAEQIAELAANE